MNKNFNYEVNWKNFKGFKDTGWIKIKPLTVLIGPNNSGKTSFIAPLLLLSQTINSRDSCSALIVKGCVYDGGNIKELLNNYDLRNDLYFGFRYQKLESPKRTPIKVGQYAPGSIEITFGINNETEREIIVKKQIIRDVLNREYVSFTRNNADKYTIGGMNPEKLLENERIAIENSSPVNFLFTPDSIITNLINQPEKNNKRWSHEFSETLKPLSYSTSQITKILGTLSYIGPIRDSPHRVYEVSNESYNTVGHRGENTPNLIKRYINEIGAELNEWVRKFDFGDSLEFKPLYGNLYSIRFREKNKEKYTSIANAGFGASQLLPLIIQALISTEDSITVAEQPEIHLNPKLQCVLADLFAFMATKNKHIIVETHSEHLLLRLRYLIAKKTISADDVAVYFIEKVNGSSKIKEVKIENDGHINPTNWPSDFFGDTLRESLALATEQFKSNK